MFSVLQVGVRLHCAASEPPGRAWTDLGVAFRVQCHVIRAACNGSLAEHASVNLHGSQAVGKLVCCLLQVRI